MKPNSPFSKLPSLGEMLEHPTVQGVVDRVSQTTIAQRATNFWDELQSTWVGQSSVPSVGELAERLAQHLLGRSRNCVPMVNATGVVCSRRWQTPLAEAAARELLRYSSDYQQTSQAMMESVVASLVKLTGAEAAWVASNYEAAVGVANQCDGAKVDLGCLIGLTDPADFGCEHVDTITDRLQGDVDLVVVDGTGLLGGPRCGIVVGSKRAVEQLLSNELAPALAAEPMTLAALEATLEIYRSPEQLMHQIPVHQLLSAPLENLRQRCERIAPLLAECEAVESAEAVEVQSVWFDDGATQLVSASWAIALRSDQLSVERMAQRFDEASPRVIGRVEQDAYWLDFRAMFPRWDQQLITVFEQSNA